jgi:hypothetical protein
MDGELERLGERIAEQAAHLDAAMQRWLADLRAFDARGGWHVQGAMSCAHWLVWRVGWDRVTARERVRVARRLEECSVIDDARLHAGDRASVSADDRCSLEACSRSTMAHAARAVSVDRQTARRK